MLQQNDPAPDFELTADDASTVRLRDLRGERVILYFYPRAGTPGCTTEACEFREAHPALEQRGAVVLGVSPDTVEEVRKFRAKHDLPFQLLADPEHTVAERYGVWKKKSMYGKQFWGVERTTFVIDADGRIERVYRRVRPKGHAQAVTDAL